MIRRVLAIAAVVVTALLLQSTVFGQLRLLGVRPELLYLVTIAIALLEGPNEGATVGFASGLAQDFLMNEPKGLTALTLTLLGYSVGMFRQFIVSPSPLVPTIVVAVGDGGGPGVLRGRVGAARELPRASGIRRSRGPPGGSVQRSPHTDPLPPPATHHRGIPTSEGGAVLDGQDVVQDQGAGAAGGVDVRRALDPAVVPPGPRDDPVPAGGAGQQRPVRVHGTVAWPDVRRPRPPAGREPGEPRGPREP